jgi:hypothetical protein
MRRSFELQPLTPFIYQSIVQIGYSYTHTPTTRSPPPKLLTPADFPVGPVIGNVTVEPGEAGALLCEIVEVEIVELVLDEV